MAMAAELLGFRNRKNQYFRGRPEGGGRND